MAHLLCGIIVVVQMSVDGNVLREVRNKCHLKLMENSRKILKLFCA